MASRTRRIEIRVTEDERALEEAAASAQGETLSEFVRRAALREAEQVLLERTSFAVDDDAARRFLAEVRAVHLAQTHHHAVGGGLVDQLLERVAAATGGDGERAIFDEGAWIDQVVDVLARGALAGFATAGHRVRPRARRMPFRTYPA